jgi:hypothetical protein
LHRGRLDIRGRELEVAELDQIQPDCHTDMLAVHRSALDSGAVNFRGSAH